MQDWHLTSRDLKNYPHFDPPISAQHAERYATDPERVARHPFYPFIRYEVRRRPFAKNGMPRKPKPRPIRYAARRDAHIYSRYRHLLSQAYEAELQRLGLGASVLAYRKHPLGEMRGGKCNIHFAADAFTKIRGLQNCCALALDIKGFFESLDHARLKELWCRLLAVDKLPPDHFQVYKAITEYAFVDKVRAYERLGFFGTKLSENGGPTTEGYLVPLREIPKQLCRGKEFREKICGGNGQPSIVSKNPNSFGIPQGAPISDLLANIYLLDFDLTIASWVADCGGAYYRYSDDILILVPGGRVEGFDLLDRTCKLIRNFGSELQIQETKASLVVFESDGDDQRFDLVHGKHGRNGLEYLGFRYDGCRVFLRDATLSNIER